MKKLCVFASLREIIICFSFLTFLLLISCNDSGTKSTTESMNTTENNAYAAGKTIYQKTCITCHQPDGKGMSGTYPPLANSDFLLADKNRAIAQVLKGSSTTYNVNGTAYSGVMPPQQLNDGDVAQVLNYVYHSWGNNGFTINAIDVKAVRDTLK